MTDAVATDPAVDRDETSFIDAPQVTLYVSDGASAEAEQAFEALAATGVRFRVEPATVPGERAEFGGLTFEGIDGIRVLASTLADFSAAFLDKARATMPGRFAAPDPVVLRESRERHDHDLAAARSAMKRLSPVSPP